jgi:DNA-binding SARP family transcriptional activator
MEPAAGADDWRFCNMALEFNVLGDVQARLNGRHIVIGHLQLRCMLTVLLIEANRTVSIDELVGRVWGERRWPLNPRAAVQHNVAMLRSSLAAVPDVGISWRSTGYQLVVDTENVDLHRFRRLVEKARAAGDDNDAVLLLEQVLRLWGGEPFHGLDTPWLNAVRATLTQQHEAVQLDLNDIRLRGGRHAELLAELSDQTDVRPLDERLAGQYLLALYRSGRQAQALEHYQAIRRRLADQLGTDPSPPLQRVYQQILTADPALAAPATRFTAAAASVRVPRQLPAVPHGFVGRAGELAELDTVLTGPMQALTISGAGGIGKTWLAVHWAHQNRHHFPDGQLHVNLCGFDPSGRPMPVERAVRAFLDALGVDPIEIPGDLNAQAALYRSLVADKRMLIVLDNARDTAQVVPLLPGSPTCTVLITSRSRLPGLRNTCGACLLLMDVLPQHEARELLAARVGVGRLAAEPDTADRLLACCGGVPLALSIVAGRVETHPRFPLAELANELYDGATRLGALADEEPVSSLPAVLSWSCQALKPEQAQIFGLLGLAPGPDIGLPAAAALTALPAGRTRAMLRELENVSLVRQHLPGRYCMHELVRLYAAEAARREQSVDTRTAALRRLTDFYLHSTCAADRLLAPTRAPIELPAPDPAIVPATFSDSAQAMAWLERERPVLVAAVGQAAAIGDRRAWQFSWSLSTYLDRRHRWHDLAATQRMGLSVAERHGEVRMQALAHHGLGLACYRLGLCEEAHAHYRQASELYRQLGDHNGRADIHRYIAMAFGQQQRHADTLGHAHQALILHLTASHWHGISRDLNQLGWYHSKIGHLRPALSYSQQALPLLRALGDREEEASACDNLGQVHHQLGDYAQALEYSESALRLWRELGDRHAEASLLNRLIVIHQALATRTRPTESDLPALAAGAKRPRYGLPQGISSSLPDSRS